MKEFFYLIGAVIPVMGTVRKISQENSRRVFKHPRVFHLCDIHVKGGNAFLHILQKQNLIPGVQLIKGAAGPGQHGYISAGQNAGRRPSPDGLKAFLPGRVPKLQLLLHIEGCKQAGPGVVVKILQHVGAHHGAVEGDQIPKHLEY